MSEQIAEVSSEYLVEAKKNDVPVGYRLTEVGVIPNDWKINTISQSMKLINGYGFKPSEWCSEGWPIIRIQNLNDIDAPYNYFNGNIDERYYVDYGDLLFAWSDTKGTKELEERYAEPLPAISQSVDALSDKVAGHLKAMGLEWSA